jgi:catechol 2,3-dioxygenase-like lactoylglutathione lyase family enzyme
MEQRLSLVTLGVDDLDRARRFYEDGLGWRRGNDDAGVAFYQLPGMVLALWSRQALAEDAGLSADVGRGDGFGGVALAFNAREADEVDRVIGEAERAGAKILKRPAKTFWGGYSGYFSDPDGHVWEVAHNPFWRIDAEGKVRLGSVGGA